MGAAVRKFYPTESSVPRLATSKTTLYDLIETIDEEVEPGEEWLVAKTVMHLIDTGKVTFVNDEVRV